MERYFDQYDTTTLDAKEIDLRTLYAPHNPAFNNLVSRAYDAGVARGTTRTWRRVRWVAVWTAAMMYAMALMSRNAHAQQNIGPISTPQVNTTLYVGQTGYPTVQAAVTQACNMTAKSAYTVLIPIDATPPDSPSTVTGCAKVRVTDQRPTPAAQYGWNGTIYVQVGLPAQGVLGIPSGGDATTTAGNITSATTISLLSAQSFQVGQGVWVGHAGLVCGLRKGVACPSGPTPTFVSNAPGATTYTYSTKCVDGLGGSGTPGTSANFPTGPTTLSATSSITLTLPAQPGCLETLIYRNGSLSGAKYLPPTGTAQWIDVGVGPQGQGGPFTHRDYPSTNTAGLNDNYVGFITAIQGNTITVSPAMTQATGTETVAHSDSPMLQRAMDSGDVNNPFNGSRDHPNGPNYRLNYPINLTGHSGTYTFAAALDTGDMAFDLTGQSRINFFGVSLNAAMPMTAESSIGIFCARENQAGNPQGQIAQDFNSESLFIDTHGILSGAANLGAVGVYNYGCEVEHHDAPDVNTEAPWIFTASNIGNVQSLFDPNQFEGFTSMSAITLLAPKGGSIGTFFTADNTYSLNMIGGYMYGGESDTNPYAFELWGNNGDLNLNGFRVEGKGGAIWNHNGAANGGSINLDVNYNNKAPGMFRLGDGASMNGFNFLHADNFGGTPQHIPFVSCDTSNCLLSENDVVVGVNQDWSSTYDNHNRGSLFNRGMLIPSNTFANLTQGSMAWAYGHGLPIGTNLDSVTGCAWYEVANATSSGTYPIPAGTTQQPIYSIVRNNCSGNPQYLFQEVMNMNGAPTNDIFRRQRGADGWHTWVQSGPTVPVGTGQYFNGRCGNNTQGQPMQPLFVQGVATGQCQ